VSEAEKGVIDERWRLSPRHSNGLAFKEVDFLKYRGFSARLVQDDVEVTLGRAPSTSLSNTCARSLPI